MAPSTTVLCLVLANLLVPAAILIFAGGFFPYKPFLPGVAKYEVLDYGEPPVAPFDKVIFMVVDALRSDFVYGEGSGFAYTQKLISNGSAIPFTAHAASPTITMPRIKAITTGSIPSFLDVILNFAESDTSSTLATQDTWLAQMRAKGTGKMVMYGDDTWIKLFPDSFDRMDGTSSFFVADFTEVDNNVTRHIPEELGNDDWNTMVLHFLGLDHIGHKAGPRSPNMIPKQREMDSIVQQVYTAIESYEYLKNTLFVMCGDHGMNDAGNHGGSSPGETSPALVLISPKLRSISGGKQSPHEIKDDFQYYSTIEQSDVAPTLAGLLGFPIPRNNLGVFIEDLLPFWSNKRDRVQILLRNAMQILHIVTATFSPSLFALDRDMSTCSDSSIDSLGCEWVLVLEKLKQVQPDSDRSLGELTVALSKWSRDAQEIMSSTASNYDMFKLKIGQVIASAAATFALGAAIPTLTRSFVSCIPFLTITIAYGFMMFASSYVEEEQHFWYWTTSGWLGLLTFKGISRYARSSALIDLGALGILGALRIVRRWNQTGQKFAGELDIARAYFSENTEQLWGLITATYVWNAQTLGTLGFPRLPRRTASILAVILTVLGATFKLAFTNEDAPELISGRARTILRLSAGWDLLTRARIVFQSIAICLVFTIGCEFFYATKHVPGFRSSTMRTIHGLLTLFLITQSRATNIPLLLIFQLQLSLLEKLNLNVIEITTTSLLLQYTSFFAFSGSNAISSIDLSSAYNGVSGYNVLAVGLLTFASNWSGPIFWTSATNILLVHQRRNGAPNVWKQHLSLLTLFVTMSLVGVMVACTVLRTHLFIWTVFSPKYLYSMAWAFGQHLLINVALGSFLFWLSCR